MTTKYIYNILIMNKIIILTRCSTAKQEIESQRKETVEYAKTLGFNEDQMIFVGSVAASAVKMDRTYQENMDKVYSLCNNGDVEAVVSWALNRIGRDEEFLMRFKNYCIKNKIQLYTKEPTMYLLNPDGTVNSGMELAFSLHITLAKQSAQELKAKSSRGLQRNKKLGKWWGGKRPLFGHYLDAENYLQIDENTSKIVIDIFERYSTGQYSYGQLTNYVNERYGMSVDAQWIKQKLINETYYNGEGYKPIITKDLFDKCKAVMAVRRSENYTPASYKRHTFANKILRCSCGRGYTVTSSAGHLMYRCSGCGKGENIRASNLDGLLWAIASHLEGERILKSDYQKEYKEKQAVIRDKIKALDKTTAKAEKAKERAKEAYLNGVIDLGEYKAKVGDIESKTKDAVDTINKYKEELVAIEQLLNESKSGIERLLKVSNQISESDEEEMFNIVRRWITKIEVKDHLVTVHTIIRDYKAFYYPQSNVRRWTSQYGYTLAVLPLVRSKEGCHLDSKGKFNIKTDLPHTIAWLGGSTII